MPLDAYKVSSYTCLDSREKGATQVLWAEMTPFCSVLIWLSEHSFIYLPAGLGPGASSSPRAEASSFLQTVWNPHEAKINISYYENTKGKTHLNCHLVGHNSQTEKYLDSMHIYLPVCRCQPAEQTAGRGGVSIWLSISGNTSMYVLVQSSGSKSIQVFGTSVFFPGWKCAKLIINLKHTITSTENICYTQR